MIDRNPNLKNFDWFNDYNDTRAWAAQARPELVPELDLGYAKWLQMNSYPRLVELQYSECGEHSSRLVVVQNQTHYHEVTSKCRRAVIVDWRSIPVNELAISVGDLMRLMKLI